MQEVFVFNFTPETWGDLRDIDPARLGKFDTYKKPSKNTLKKGDIVLVRLTGGSYGVRAVWYFDRLLNLDETDEEGQLFEPRSKGPYQWRFLCRPVAVLPRPFSEQFDVRGTHSRKIPDHPKGALQHSITHLKSSKAIAYLSHILMEFEADLDRTFDYMGETKSVDVFLRECIKSRLVVDQPKALLELQELADFSEPPEPPDGERRCRDAALAHGIKELHGFRCQICDTRIDFSSGKPYVEAHHIRPLSHDGPDKSENIICVCPNHHVQLDYGAIKLDSSALMRRNVHTIADEYIVYHNIEIFGKH